MASSQPQLPPPNSARLAITSLCNVLQHYGITTAEPEVIRQAKFDGPVVGLMWRILHDTVLVVLAGCQHTASAQEAMSRLWEQLHLELAEDMGPDDFPPEGAALILRQLAVWGAPLELLRSIGAPAGLSLAGDRTAGGDPAAAWQPGARPSPPARSRPLLLALGWLVAVGGLFDRTVSELEPAPQLQELLPPYPQDSCASPGVQAAYDTAAQDARDHVRRMATGNTANAADTAAAGKARGPSGLGSARGRDPFGPSPAALAAEAVWADVEAAAQRAVMLCGRIRSRIVTLQAAMDCRHRLSHALWSRQATASPSSRPLTPYELQLCAQPASVQRHVAALESATLALLEQQELAARGGLFFEWLGSVLQEEQQHRRQQQRHVDGGDREKAPAPTASGPLASLEHLPYASSEAGTRLMAHLQTQLEGAVQAAGPELAAACKRLAARAGGAGAGPHGPEATPTTAARGPAQSVTLQHLLSLAEQAVPEPYPGGDPLGTASGPAGQGDGGSSLPGALSGIEDADCRAPWRLPGDVAAALTAVHDAHSCKRSIAAAEAERFRQTRYAALLRYDFSGPQGGHGVGIAGAGVGGPLASVLAAAAAAGGTAAGGPGVAAVDETQRLLAAVLAAARPLAKTRASHKAALLGAIEDLPEGYLVAGI